MPNHLHLILVRTTKPAPDFARLTGLLGAISKRVGTASLWQPIPSPAEIPDKHHLRRQIRYLALNPCRKKLCSDPLEWYWSTYREIMGASADHPDGPTHLISALGESTKQFQVRFHSYVSADPSVHVTGTPAPNPAIPKEWAEESIGQILAASAGALRMRPSHVQKRGRLRAIFIHLAYRFGWGQPLLLSRICGTSRCAVHLAINRPPPPGMKAAELCLGDRRLRPEKPFIELKNL